MPVTSSLESQPFKTKVLHQLRQVFKLPVIERWLAGKTQGSAMNKLVYKIVPHSYTYAHPSFRYFERSGLRVKVDISDYLGHALYFGYDNEEAKSHRQLLKLIKPGFVCIDVGANVGYLSLMMASMADGVKVIGFEPDPLNFQRAEENLSLNHSDLVKIYNLGLGDEKGKALLEVRTSFNLGGNRIAKPGGQGAQISVSTMDLFFYNNPVEHIDLIKIDVEGYEFKVLRGARRRIEQDHPLLFVEINDDNLRYQGDTASQLLLYLTELGYHYFENTVTGEQISTRTDFTGLHFDLLARA